MTTLTMPTRLSILNAVNFILGLAGENQVSRTRENSTSIQVENLLARVSTEVQADGWAFCTDVNQLFTPNNSGIIELANNILSFYPVGEFYDQDLVRRDGKLFNRTTGSFTFSAPIRMDVIRPLGFTDLPQVAAWHITLKAALQFLSAEYPNNPSVITLGGEVEGSLADLARFDSRSTYARITSDVLNGTGRITKLEAVNILLSYMKRPPSRILRGNPDAIRAEHLLLGEMRRVLGEGWTFNTYFDQELTPNGDDKIEAPDGWLAISPSRGYEDLDLIVQGDFLFDKAGDGEGLIFADPIKVNIVKNIPFEDLPQPAAWYVTVRAAVEMIGGDPQSKPDVMTYLAGELRRSRSHLESYDKSMRPGTLTTLNPHFARHRGGRRRRSV